MQYSDIMNKIGRILKLDVPNSLKHLFIKLLMEWFLIISQNIVGINS